MNNKDLADRFDGIKGRPVEDNGPQTKYNGVQGRGVPLTSRVAHTAPDVDDIPGVDIPKRNSGLIIERDGKAITVDSLAQIMAFCKLNNVGKYPNGMSVNEAARRLSVDRVTIRKLLKNFSDGAVGANVVYDDIDFDLYKRQIFQNMFATLGIMNELSEMAGEELFRRLEEQPEEINTASLIKIIEKTQANNVLTFKQLSDEEDSDRTKTQGGMTDSDKLEELKGIFATAKERLDLQEREATVYEGILGEQKDTIE